MPIPTFVGVGIGLATFVVRPRFVTTFFQVRHILMNFCHFFNLKTFAHSGRKVKHMNKTVDAIIEKNKQQLIESLQQSILLSRSVKKSESTCPDWPRMHLYQSPTQQILPDQRNQTGNQVRNQTGNQVRNQASHQARPAETGRFFLSVPRREPISMN